MAAPGFPSRSFATQQGLSSSLIFNSENLKEGPCHVPSLCPVPNLWLGLEGGWRPRAQAQRLRGVCSQHSQQGTFSLLLARITRLQGHLVPPRFATQERRGEAAGPQDRGRGSPSKLHGRGSDKGHWAGAHMWPLLVLPDTTAEALWGKPGC